VTHDQEEALTMSDRIAVMENGQVLQVGTPIEVYERPECRFVADFIGETNFIEGVVQETNPDHITVVSSDGIQLQGYAPQPVQTGMHVTLSIRPEKVRLTPLDEAATLDTKSSKNRNGVNSMPVCVEHVNYIGSDTHITVRLKDDRIFDVWEPNTRSTLDRDEYWELGEQAILTCPAENALILTE
jgi:spermidine/putrescine transport system ATP-binding protein